MIEKICDIGMIPVYSDPYMEDNKILKGRKQGSSTTFIIANPKTANILYRSYMRKTRKEKLEKINEYDR